MSNAFYREQTELLPQSPFNDVARFMIAMSQYPLQLGECLEAGSAERQAAIELAHTLMFGDGSGFKKGELRELEEAWAAFKRGPSVERLTEFVDGAIDSIYVIIWTLHKLNLPVHALWAEVQRSNMAKLGPDGKPIKDPETGKIKKPEGWQPPDLFGLLQEAASQVTYVGGIARHD